MEEPKDKVFTVTQKTPPTDIEEIKKFHSLGTFGKFFTDHMAIASWNIEEGWHNFEIKPRDVFQIAPENMIFHYGQEIFEGMKAFYTKDHEIVLFRPEQNAKRFNNSAKRLAMPSLPEEIFLSAVENLVKIDKAWVPKVEGASLYIRPFMYANENSLGLGAAKNYSFCVIACPVGSYFKTTNRCLKLWVEPEYSRAASGGTGAAKCGGNYAASVIALNKAYEKGCDQVLFLDAKEKKWIEELGGMNIFFITHDKKFITPPLNGNILPGITRDSILQIAQSLNYKTDEKAYSLEQLLHDIKNRIVTEAFACGTAASVAPIGEIHHNHGKICINDASEGPLTKEVRLKLINIQTGYDKDEKNWCKKVTI